MKELDKYHVVADAVRIEHESKTDTVYIVFQIIDEQFKKRVKKDWTKDIDLKVIDVYDGDKTLHKLVEIK